MANRQPRRQRSRRTPASVPFDVQDEAERAIADDREFMRWLAERQVNLDDYVEGLCEDRSVLCEEHGEVC